MVEAAKAVLPEISANLARLVEGVSQSVVEVQMGEARSRAELYGAQTS